MKLIIPLIGAVVIIISVAALLFMGQNPSSSVTPNVGNNVQTTQPPSTTPKMPIEDVLRYCTISYGDVQQFNAAVAGDPNALAYLKSAKCLSLFEPGGSDIQDVSILAQLSNLEALSLSWTQVSDISPLNALTSLRSLTLENTKVSDIFALSGMVDMELLVISYTNVSDISSIKNMKKLRALNIRNTQISDITPLAYLENLEELEYSIALDPNNFYQPSLDITSPSVKTVYDNYFHVNMTCLDVTPITGLRNLKQVRIGDLQICEPELLYSLNGLQKLSIKIVMANDCSEFKENFPNKTTQVSC